MTPEQETLLRRYAEAVVSSPPHLHLTSDRDLRQFWVRHVEDALKLIELIPPPYRKAVCRVLDVGSGNGIPGIPVAIAEPTWGVELLDSDTKKCGFLDTFCKSNGLRNSRVIVGRAESLAQGAFRDSYDIVFSRAIGKLRIALELSGAFVKLGGLLVVPHGTSWEAELKESSLAIELLGLQPIGNISYLLDNIKFWALLFAKVNQTPAIYPRPVGVPDKKPL